MINMNKRRQERQKMAINKAMAEKQKADADEIKQLKSQKAELESPRFNTKIEAREYIDDMLDKTDPE